MSYIKTKCGRMWLFPSTIFKGTTWWYLGTGIGKCSELQKQNLCFLNGKDFGYSGTPRDVLQRFSTGVSIWPAYGSYSVASAADHRVTHTPSLCITKSTASTSLVWSQQPCQLRRPKAYLSESASQQKCYFSLGASPSGLLYLKVDFGRGVKKSAQILYPWGQHGKKDYPSAMCSWAHCTLRISVINGKYFPWKSQMSFTWKRTKWVQSTSQIKPVKHIQDLTTFKNSTISRTENELF